MHKFKQQGLEGKFSVLGTFVVFALVLVVLFIGTRNLSSGAGQEGAAATYQAIERAAVLCYATEGFYPPGLQYIKTFYGVQVDENRYAVRYEVHASNIMPTIRVVSL